VLLPPVARVAVRVLSAAPPWRAVVERLRGTAGFWLLESARTHERTGRWSLAGAGPLGAVRARRDRIEAEPWRVDAPFARRRWRGDPFDALRALVPHVSQADAPAPLPFVGGAVGWLGYELAAHLERVPVRMGGEVAAADAAWLLVDRVLGLDHGTGDLVVAALGFGDAAAAASACAERAAERLAARLARGDPDPFEAGPPRHADAPGPERGPGPEPLRWSDPGTGLEVAAWFDAPSYTKSVRTIQDEIAAGALYQANLTHRLALGFGGDAFALYAALRERSPAPFAAFLALPEITVVGSSPERFLRLDPDGLAESRPIKGTRPRGATPADDARLRAELAGSEKERAENAMIVDLVRNDLGRVCVPGSVAVPALCEIERYRTLFQMVSTVTGRLRPDRDRVDLLRACFPPGSMTGAPKIAAIELLARLEPVRRGIYAGALGYLDARGGMDLSVVIRTLLCRGRRVWLHVGGGIVLDSDPAAEWAETLAKARAPLDAVAACR
jgi:para-aminobenzoate synthetase component 1